MDGEQSVEGIVERDLWCRLAGRVFAGRKGSGGPCRRCHVTHCPPVAHALCASCHYTRSYRALYILNWIYRCHVFTSCQDDVECR